MVHSTEPTNTFDEERLRRKLSGLPRTVSRRLVRSALTLFALLRDPATPAWAKATVILALCYFVCPVDGVPDVLPGGLIDDLVVMTAALSRLAKWRDNPAVLQRVRKLEKRWTPDWWHSAS